jgi:hypothetical protein
LREILEGAATSASNGMRIAALSKIDSTRTAELRPEISKILTDSKVVFEAVERVRTEVSENFGRIEFIT